MKYNCRKSSSIHEKARILVVGIFSREEDIDYLKFLTGFSGRHQNLDLFFLTNRCQCFWEIGSNQSKDLLNSYLFRQFLDF
jgi:hypothetical protein